MSSVKRKRLALCRAFTLVEVLIAGSLGLLVGIVAFLLLSAFLRSCSELAALNQIQEQAAISLGWVGADARRSAVRGVTIEKGQVAFCGLVEVDSRGRQIWDQSARCYRQRGEELVRQESPVAEWSGLMPMRLSPDQFQQIQRSSQGTLLCRNVDAFEVSLYGPDQAASPLTVTLRVKQRLAGKVHRLEISRDFCLRNSL